MTNWPEAAHRTFFTSDEHYGHRNILNFCKRPFKDVNHMREVMVARHNEQVPRGGITYHLGDMFWQANVTEEEAHSILDRLNGQHFLIWGNHDKLIENSESLQKRFVWCKDLVQLHIKPFKKIVLCHYAMRVWRGSHNGSWHLYGHSHGDLEHTHETKSFDVGVDTNGYAPVSLAEVARRMEHRHVVRNHLPCNHCGFCVDCLRIEQWNEEEQRG